VAQISRKLLDAFLADWLAGGPTHGAGGQPPKLISEQPSHSSRRAGPKGVLSRQCVASSTLGRLDDRTSRSEPGIEEEVPPREQPDAVVQWLAFALGEIQAAVSWIAYSRLARRWKARGRPSLYFNYAYAAGWAAILAALVVLTAARPAFAIAAATIASRRHPRDNRRRLTSIACTPTEMQSEMVQESASSSTPQSFIPVLRSDMATTSRRFRLARIHPICCAGD
jgi:hypothetical protein